jgi:hypothetical protein
MQTSNMNPLESTRSHLWSALEMADDPDEIRHLREALQLLEVVEEQDELFN